MKEASGELNLTVITVVAIAAVGAILWSQWGNIKNAISGAWGGCGDGYHMVPNEDGGNDCVAD